jgi:hypothetical protein
MITIEFFSFKLHILTISFIKNVTFDVTTSKLNFLPFIRVVFTFLDEKRRNKLVKIHLKNKKISP